MNQPDTIKDSVVENFFGNKIVDSYRWLEDGASPEVIEWINKQNIHSESLLKNNNFDKFSTELIKNFKSTDFSTPFPVAGYYFYTERKADEEQFILYVKKGLDGKPVKVVDPNELGDNTTLSFWYPSRSGKYLAYGLFSNGDEMATLYIKDVTKNENLIESIERCRHSSVSWLPDDSGFFYTKNPNVGEVPKNEEHLHTKVFLHLLGNNPINDEIIFGNNRPKDDMINITLSINGKYLSIQVGQTWTKNQIYIYDTINKTTHTLVKDLPAKFDLFFLSNKVLLLTNYQASNFKLLSADINDFLKPLESWQELVRESNYLLETVAPTRDLIILEYLVNACSQIKVIHQDGKEFDIISVPPYSTITSFGNNRTESELFFGITSFTFPKIIYHFDPKNNKPSIYRSVENLINPDDYLIKQEWYQSKDETKVPMFVFHKKDLDLSVAHPTILYGYGGFGSSETPSFMKGWLPWISRGGIFAIANIRGGGEFGHQWHEEGIKKNKQNSFDDFIFGAEYLINKKYTSKNKLGILGGSNGGLLVSTVAVQKPDLFKAVCARVPLTDMVRFPKFGIAIRWVHEYGDPEIKEELESILKWSPYHNVISGIKYPSFLFITGEKDTRVDPMHARKMAALLQSVSRDNKILIITESKAGHGPGRPVSKIVENQAFTLSFFSTELDLKI